MNPEWVHALIGAGGVLVSAGIAIGAIKVFIKSTEETQVRLERKIDHVAEKLEEHREASKKRDEDLAERINEAREVAAKMEGRLLGPYNTQRASSR